MRLILEGNAKEIAALVFAIQERRGEDVYSDLAKGLHQALQDQLAAVRADREPR